MDGTTQRSSYLFNRIKIFLSLSFILLIIYPLSGHDNVSFKHLYVEDGLSQSTILTLFQSRDRFLWFGTIAGLNRYDGYTIQIYNTQSDNGLTGDYITCIAEDNKGILWIGTKNNGLNRYDPQNKRFEAYKPNKGFTKSVFPPTIRDILVDTDGSLWIAHQNRGVSHLYPDSGIFIYYTHKSNDEKSLSSDDVLKIYLDRDNHLWFATTKGLNRFYREKQQFVTVSLSEGSQPNIQSINQNKDGSIWIGTDNGRFYRINPQSGNVKSFQLPGKHRGQSIRDISFHPYTGEVIIGTYGGGLFFYDPVKNNFKQYQHQFYEPSSLSNNHIIKLLIDRSDNLWIGTLKGVNKIDLKPKKFGLFRIGKANKKIDKVTFDNFITTVYKDAKDDIWMGLYGYSLVRFQRQTHRVKYFLNQAGIGTIWDIVRDDEQHLWLASEKGLVRFNAINGTYTVLSLPPSVYPNKKQTILTRILKISSRYLYLGFLDGSFIRYDLSKNRFLRVSTKKLNQALESILEMYQDREGNIWLGTEGYGLYQYDPRSNSIRNYFAGTDSLAWLQRISAIKEDRWGRLWLATSKGIAIVDTKNRKIHRITTRDGLNNNFIYALEHGRKNEFWLSSNRGLSSIHILGKDQYEITNYGVEDGLQSNEFNTHCSFRANDGELLFGGINGLNYFYPENVIQNPYQPDLAITRFEVNDQEQQFNPAGKTIRLPYNKNNIRFEFAALEFTNPKENKYQYMLEGFNKNWIDAGSRRQATYTNLSPGEYTFVVKACNNDNVWNPSGTWVKLQIADPFWLTPFAYLIYVIIAVSLIFLVIKFRSRKLEKINQLLEQRVNEKTKEVRESYLRLRESQEQLIESAKMRAIGTMASGIVHDFNNLLSIILGSVQLVIQKNKDESLHKHLEYIQTAVKDGAKIIQKIQDFSRRSEEKTTSQIDVNEMLKMVVEMTQFKWLAQKRMQGIHIDFELNLEQVPAIRAISSELRLAFTNIIINAIESFNKSGKIYITTKTLEEQWVIISIRDEGKGMDQETVKRVFEPFYSTKGTAGNGLGLAQVYGIISRSNGAVEISSEPDVGTQVTIRLPVSRGTGDKEEHASLPEEDKYYEKRILVVEDELTIREIYEGILSPQGYSLVMTETAEEGLEHFSNEEFDLIICDLGLPGMNGWEFVHKVRLQNKDIPIIVITGWATDDHKKKLNELKIQKILPKPVSVSDLKKNVSLFLS